MKKGVRMFLVSLFHTALIIGQTGPRDSVAIKTHRCATPPPGAGWDGMFNKMVEQYKSTLSVERISSVTTYTIPIIFHIIHGGQPEGTYPNLSQSLINDQVTILNADYAGTGYNATEWSALTLNGHPLFYDYAVANDLPAPDNNGINVATAGISFGLANQDPSGNALAEPGIDRINYVTRAWKNPAATYESNTIMNYMDDSIKPATIWDPTRYFNVWVSDINPSSLYLGYSTFPSGTSLSGLSGGDGGSENATSSIDGCWVLASTVGNSGIAYAPYNLGRTLTHESGHYLGLRHVWGDGDCATDYCNDTPGAETFNYYSGPAFTYPYHNGTCSDNAKDGEMYMNFMDYSNDRFMFMFTNDQIIRMYTALSQSPDRTGLTTASARLCGPFIAGINTVELDVSVKIFPNPSANGQFTLKFNFQKQTDLTIIVSNVLGQRLLTQLEKSTLNQNIALDLSNYGTGSYFVTIKSETGTITRRIVITG